MKNELALNILAQDTLRHIGTLRDAFRVRLHLASMELAELWKGLSPKLDAVEGKLRDVLDRWVDGGSEQVRLELALGLAEARDLLRALRTRSHDVEEALGQAGRAALRTIEARLAEVPNAA